MHSEDFNIAGSRAEKAFEDFDGGCLSRAVRSKESEALASIDLKIDPIYGINSASASLVLFAQASDRRLQLRR